VQEANLPETTATIIDPVCGMTVAATSAHRYQHLDVGYRFCCEGCQQKFVRDPEHYLSGAAQQDIAPVPGALYICPMDPEIEQDHPGSCPICGMALEARTIEVEEQNEELIDMPRRFRISVADPVKESTTEAIRELHAEGVSIVMLTGDNRITAEAVAKKLGIDRIQADVSPEQKADIVKQLQAAGKKVAMAGDGINDAPALAQADVGIAMGTGTDVAIESAGITLVKGDLRGILRARQLSRATTRNIRQNLFLRSPTTRSECRLPPECSIRCSACCCHR
jgi:soluble P-type ATPase/YHS domain-containing protein